MSKKICYALFACLVCVAGCVDLPDITLGGPSEASNAGITRVAVQEYLEKAELARPDVVTKVTSALRRGKVFRERVLDQRNKWCLATVWIDANRSNTLHINTKRDETCPECGGTGKRKWKNMNIAKLPFDTRCLKCKGEGFLPNYVMERQFILSAEDYIDTKTARKAIARNAYQGAPPGTETYVQMLASNNARERLEACIWLDRNYVREGEFFQTYMPMLKKARWRETNEKMKIGVYQFWAGKDIPGEHTRCYYRIYIDTRSGKVKEKGFYPEQ